MYVWTARLEMRLLSLERQRDPPQDPALLSSKRKRIIPGEPSSFNPSRYTTRPLYLRDRCALHAPYPSSPNIVRVIADLVVTSKLSSARSLLRCDRVPRSEELFRNPHRVSPGELSCPVAGHFFSGVYRSVADPGKSDTTKKTRSPNG